MIQMGMMAVAGSLDFDKGLEEVAETGEGRGASIVSSLTSRYDFSWDMVAVRGGGGGVNAVGKKRQGS